MSAPPTQDDERQRLLTPETPPGPVYTTPHNVDGEIGQSEAVLQPRKTRSKLRIAWYIFLIIVSALILAVFIKGWIDAGDTDVSWVVTWHDKTHISLRLQFDLKEALWDALGGGLSGAAGLFIYLFSGLNSDRFSS